jgi:2'-5' RNA ligase
MRNAEAELKSIVNLLTTSCKRICDKQKVYNFYVHVTVHRDKLCVHVTVHRDKLCVHVTVHRDKFPYNKTNQIH